MEEQLTLDSAPHFPIFLNLARRLVVVVGAGRVGARKATALLSAGARVRLVDPHATTLDSFPNRPSESLLRIAESYRSDHLTGASLVFAAATPTVNACVVADAQERGLWVNSATNPSAGDFILPSVVRSGQFTLATSTAGTAPALARRVKEKLAAEFDRAFADWLEVLGEMRKQVLTTISDEVPRRQLLEDFADWPWLERVRAEGVAAVRLAMEAIVRATGNRKGDS